MTPATAEAITEQCIRLESRTGKRPRYLQLAPDTELVALRQESVRVFVPDGPDVIMAGGYRLVVVRDRAMPPGTWEVAEGVW